MIDASELIDLLAHQPYASGQPPASGLLRARLEDFVVDEVLPFSASGEGEHVMLHLQKRGANTQWVAGQLARFAGVRPVNVSFAGQKDRNAVTRQYFSVHLPGRDDPDWSQLCIEGVQVLSHHRHHRKLRRGALSGNRFELCLREISGDLDDLAERIARIKQQGVPNYFGPQRFGRGGSNLSGALRMFAGARIPRQRRGMLLSAARSFLFNQVLAERVQEQNWDQPVEGDVFILDGRHGRFGPQPIDDEIVDRINRGDIHPSGPLWGDGGSEAGGKAQALEHAVVHNYPELVEGLERARLNRDRRALRVIPKGLRWDLEADQLRIRFELPAGCFATTVLRECVAFRTPEQTPETDDTDSLPNQAEGGDA